MGVVLLLVLLVGLTACGDDDEPSGGGDALPPTTGAAEGDPSTTSASEASDVDPDGVLRIGVDLTSGGQRFLDPVDENTPSEFHIHYNIYGTLLRQLEDGSYEPGLATRAEIVDARRIDVELRAGVTFSDGTPLTAEDVKFSIERNIAANKPAPFRMEELGNVAEVEVTGPETFTIHLKEPTAGSFFNLLAHNETMPVSKRAVESGVDLNVQPIGAGPFTLVSQDNQHIVLEKNPRYWAADRVRLAGIEYVHVAAGQAAIPLQSGVVDVMATSFLVNNEFRRTDVEVRSEKSHDAVVWVSMQCPEGSPLHDVRVRQALNFATDGAAINELVFGGVGEEMSQFWPESSPFFNPELKGKYSRDIGRAAALLAEAGHAELPLKVAVVPGLNTRIAEILQAQWAEAGIDVELVPTSNIVQDYYLDKRMDLFVTTQSRSWTDKITKNFVGGNACRWAAQDPQFSAEVLELRGADPAGPEAVESWHEVSATLADNAYAVFLLMGTVDNAWNDDRLGNPSWTPTQVGVLYPDVHAVYVKQT